MKKEIKGHWRTWIFLLTLGTVLIIVYKALDSIGYLGNAIRNFISIISPFLAGLLLAYLLYIPEHKIENTYKKSKYKFLRKKARNLAILTTYIILILILIILINVILPVLVESVNELIGNLQSYYSQIVTTYNNLPDDSIFKTEQIYSAIQELQNLNIKQYLTVDYITEYVKSAFSMAHIIFDIFVAIVVSIYILSERNDIFSFFKKLLCTFFKTDTARSIEGYFYTSNNIFFKFISSQFIDAIIIAIVTSIAMSFLHIKYASLLGFTIGLFNMIPYFGAIFAVAMAALVTLMTSGFSKTIAMLIVIIILQQIDANIINPKIIGDSLKISPLIVILAVTIGRSLFWSYWNVFRSSCCSCFKNFGKRLH